MSRIYLRVNKRLLWTRHQLCYQCASITSGTHSCADVEMKKKTATAIYLRVVRLKWAREAQSYMIIRVLF